MNSVIVERLPRVEGRIRVTMRPWEEDSRILLESGRTTHLESRLIGRYPLEALHLVQTLSAKSCAAHAMASVMALENYLDIKPTPSAQRIRSIILQLSTIHSHIRHFYWELLPDYINGDHFSHRSIRELGLYFGLEQRRGEPGDLPVPQGKKILDSLPAAADALRTIQLVLTDLTGKFPGLMNIIPGGVSNFSVERKTVMSILRSLEGLKEFVETIWPEDVKLFVLEIPETIVVLDDSLNLISFGSLPAGDAGQTPPYSSGVFLDGKLEPVNELKITESLVNTYYLPIGEESDTIGNFDFDKANAYTWIKGARYETEPMATGALSRMLITHFGGGDMEVSDTIMKLVDNLGLSSESPNCIASRLLAEVFESRFYLKLLLRNLIRLDGESALNRRMEFDFSAPGSGTGKTEAPGGSLLHQVYIENSRIERYRIVSPTNWNFSTRDEFGKTGIVESELNKLLKNYTLSSLQASRILHSYNASVVDGTQ